MEFASCLMLLSWRPNELRMPWRCETAWLAIMLQDRTHFYDFSIKIYMGWVPVEACGSICACDFIFPDYVWIDSVVFFFFGINPTFDDHSVIIFGSHSSHQYVARGFPFQIKKRSLEKQYDQVVAGHFPPLYKKNKCCIFCNEVTESDCRTNI